MVRLLSMLVLVYQVFLVIALWICCGYKHVTYRSTSSTAAYCSCTLPVTCFFSHTSPESSPISLQSDLERKPVFLPEYYLWYFPNANESALKWNYFGGQSHPGGLCEYSLCLRFRLRDVPNHRFRYIREITSEYPGVNNDNNQGYTMQENQRFKDRWTCQYS